MQQRSEFDSHKLAMSRTALACTVADRLPLLVAVDSGFPSSSERSWYRRSDEKSATDRHHG